MSHETKSDQKATCDTRTSRPNALSVGPPPLAILLRIRPALVVGEEAHAARTARLVEEVPVYEVGVDRHEHVGRGRRVLLEVEVVGAALGVAGGGVGDRDGDEVVVVCGFVRE